MITTRVHLYKRGVASGVSPEVCLRDGAARLDVAVVVDVVHVDLVQTDTWHSQLHLSLAIVAQVLNCTQHKH